MILVVVFRVDATMASDGNVATGGMERSPSIDSLTTNALANEVTVSSMPHQPTMHPTPVPDDVTVGLTVKPVGMQ